MRTLIQGGTIVTATDSFVGDVLVDGEEVAQLGVALDSQGTDVVDATGCLVMPGLIDSHTHLDMPFAGTRTADDFDTGTAAAAAGGTTCIVDFARQVDGSLQKGLDTWMAKAYGKAHIDYGFHLVITEPTDAALSEMKAVVAEGVSTFKLFMAYKRELMVTDAGMLAVLDRTRESGGLVLVHAENGDMVDFNVARALAAGDVSPRFHALTRPEAVEAEATSRAIRLAKQAQRPLFVVHVTCEAALREIQAARDEGLPIYGETCVHYLVLTVDELARPGFEGAKYVCSPPLRSAKEHDVLWSGLRQQALGCITTDHCPFDFEQKQMGRGDFSKIPNGMPGIESRLSILFDRGVRRSKLTINELVRATSTEPARIFGLAPRKGTIAPGSHADIVVFDPELEVTISAETHHMNVDYSVFEGFVCRGAPRIVFSRGEIIYKEGELMSVPGRGRYVKRTLFEPAFLETAMEAR